MLCLRSLGLRCGFITENEFMRRLAPPVLDASLQRADLPGLERGGMIRHQAVQQFMRRLPGFRLEPGSQRLGHGCKGIGSSPPALGSRLRPRRRTDLAVLPGRAEAGEELLERRSCGRSGIVRRRTVGQGCENAMTLWRELRERGYPGTHRQVHRFVAERRTKPTWSGRKLQAETAATPERPAAGPPLPTSRQLAWLLDQPISALDAASAAVVAHIEQDGTARAVAHLARRFTALIRASGVGKTVVESRDAVADFEAWVRQAKVCGATAVASFASGLEGDAAVRASLTEPWSSGQAEGQINRLKLIKRQSYGRAGLDLLRKRMILAV